MWMSLQEAVARAGSFEALLPALIDGRIMARAAGFFAWPGGSAKPWPDRQITAHMWKTARVDPAGHRVYFAGLSKASLDGISHTVRGEVFAVGVELERAAVEALWPAKAKPSGRKRGKKPSRVWQQIFKHFDDVVTREGKYRNLNSAVIAVEDWLKVNKKTLSRSAIERGIPNYRPHWIDTA